jgi:hypothetical protein
MPHPQSLPRARHAGAPAWRARVTAPLCLALAACLICLGAEGTGGGAAAQGGEIIRLRSFAPGAAARLEVGAAGGRARLVAENLPNPGALTPDARAYVVWAASGTVRRLGLLRRNDGGAGAFEFRHPAGLARYAVVVTAESNSDAARPAGAPVFASRALEVAAAPPAPRRTPGVAATARDRVVTPSAAAAAAAPGTAAAPLAAAAEERARICAGAGCVGNDFVGEVRGALNTRRARTLLLVAARGAGGRARGVARVAGGRDAAYARLRLRRVPPPTRFGARRHVLWAVADEAGPVYLGSLPEAGLDRAETFVRAEGLTDPNFRLLVTAEQTYPAARPAGRRVLLTLKGRRSARRPRRR